MGSQELCCPACEDLSAGISAQQTDCRLDRMLQQHTHITTHTTVQMWHSSANMAVHIWYNSTDTAVQIWYSSTHKPTWAVNAMLASPSTTSTGMMTTQPWRLKLMSVCEQQSRGGHT